jgi:lia operon protein LiaF
MAERQSSNGHLIGGMVLIAIGSLFLLDRLDIFTFNVSRFIGTWWPMFLIIPGLVQAVDSTRTKKNTAFFLIAFGVLFQVAELGLFRWWRWANLWPMMMIAIGAWMLLEHLRGHERSVTQPAGSPPPRPPQF